MTNENLRSLPSVDQLLNSTELADETRELSHAIVTSVIRQVLAESRKAVKKSAGAKSAKSVSVGSEGSAESLTAQIKSRCRELSRRRITRVINGTGVMIHTNLGRSPLGKELLSRVFDRVSGYSTLEFDLISGKRGKRGEFLSYLLAQMTGADSALAVNNNAAALFLILNTFANKKEVIVSRSELVQIGGGFRIPDIVRRAGAKLVEVGTTNQTSIKDYREAISDRTAMLLKVHRSNFHLSGFVKEVAPEALAELADKKGLLSVFDLGSGAYHQTEKFGMEPEPNITSSLRTRSSLVCFSGDKLLGSSQAGIVIGKHDLITQLHDNPIYRALRLDKLTLAVLEETAFAYLRKESHTVLPLWKEITTPLSELENRASVIKNQLEKSGINAEVRRSIATPGGGSLPGGSLESIAVILKPSGKIVQLNQALLESTPPIIGYVEKNEYFIDLRTVDPREDSELTSVLIKIKSCLQ